MISTTDDALESRFEWSNERYAAEVTDCHFRALAERLEPGRILMEIPYLNRITNPKRCSQCDQSKVSIWLKNAWNTEYILGKSSGILEQAGGAALQWSFPQAYYACFAHILAFFQVAGIPESKHASLQRRFGELVASGEYPASMSFYATGTIKHPNFHGLDPAKGDYSNIHYVKGDKHFTDRLIGQFLSATRQISLKNRRDRAKLKRKDGKPKKRLSETDWEAVANKQGPTSLICLLYRKRIKGNYRDIDSFTVADFDATAILNSLETIVKVVAFVHESFIVSALGWTYFESNANKYLKTSSKHPLSRRLPYLSKLTN
jgi:hypothetical protein